MTRLYARDTLLRELVPRLTGLAHDRQQRVGQEHPDGPPVVLLTGGHGMGRTAVLDALAAAYQQRIPLARADLARADAGAARRALDVSNSSAVVEVLEALVEALAPAVPGFGRMRFTRLLPGLFAVSSWHRGNVPEQDVARRRIAGLLPACGQEGGDATDGAARWIADVSAQLAHSTGTQPDLEPVAEAVAEQFLHRHAGRRDARVIQEWYRSDAPGAEDGRQALVRLSLRFHTGGDFRRSVERVLMAAFLADVADAYRGWKRLNRAPRPLVLLDDVHNEAGRHFLGMLLEHRAGPGHERSDPLVVVATSLGGAAEFYAGATRRQLPEIAVSSGWGGTAPGLPHSGVLAVALTPLSIEDQLSLLDRAPHGLHPYLPTALHHLTGGHPLGVRVLCEAVLHAGARGPVRPEQLLGLSTPNGRPVAEELLERLVPAPQVRDHLVMLSVAWDRAAAEVLAAERAIPSADPFPAATVDRYLETEEWDAGGGTPFVAHPFLRALLVQVLRVTPQDAVTGRRWEDLHGTLREHHAAQGEAGEAAELRHILAVGDAGTVVRRLADHFPRWDASRWLDCLRGVATAPYPPQAGWTDRRRETARGTHDREYTDDGDLTRSVNRLLHALWYLTEEVAEPTEQLCDDLGAELTFLSMRHPHGHAVLNRASREWPAAAREKKPFRSPGHGEPPEES